MQFFSAAAILAFFTTYVLPVVYIALLLLAGYFLIKILLKIIGKGLTKSKIDVTQHRFVTSAIRTVLYILLVVLVLDSAGIVEMTSIIAFISIFGIAISLAVQGTLSNIASGVTILFTKPFDKGDYVQINGVEGVIVHINLTNTKLKTVDNKVIYIPNNEIATNKITNFTREDNRRLDLVFSISYSADFQLAKKVIADTINKNDKTLQEPEAPLVRVCEHGDSCIKIVAKTWVKSSDYWALNYDLLEEVKTSLDENNIEIPFNQLDVFIKNK